MQNVLELVREGIPFADIVRDYYPDLTPEDVRAFIQYAMDALAKQENHLSTMMNSSPCPDDDWFFKTMRDAIDANRKREEN